VHQNKHRALYRLVDPLHTISCATEVVVLKWVDIPDHHEMDSKQN